uniref:MucBP domain-containing protein n=1 Tax=Listeria monocytogenes TaxID=1639 RepID=UPI001F554786
MDKYNELQTVLKNKEKVLIIGPNGAGKSTFATELGKHYDFEVCHLDKLFWQENWNAVAKADFEDKVDNIMSSKKKYIIDGDYFFNLEKRLEHADLVIWIKIPLFLCVANIIKRRFKYMTNVRPDVTVTYKDTKGNQLADPVILKGDIGSTFETEAKSFKGYKLTK